ncbi:hypothetical protein SDC9_178105 [bioreactor metagenome]|uniref:Uncharacterized protein n=1 Tax=bioreactor metagenome TaxID=1076179 RepID=A0A645H2T5_9ZZZZ
MPGIEAVRITRCKNPAYSPKLFMRHNRLNQYLANPLPAICLIHNHIAKPKYRCIIGDAARKTDLHAIGIHAEAERMLNGFFDGLAAPLVRPIGSGEQRAYAVDLQSFRVVANEI